MLAFFIIGEMDAEVVRVLVEVVEVDGSDEKAEEVEEQNDGDDVEVEVE